MPDLVSLTFRTVELATRPIRWAVGQMLEFVSEGEPAGAPAAPPAPPPPPADPPPPRSKRGSPARRPSPKQARRATRHEPTRGEAAALREQQREAEWGDGDGPGANVIIDEEVLRAVGRDPDKP